ncbi:MAG TPA: glycosyltransferase [Chlamydiales bacterium]|nr:glycosyltransferase [Chlamydiales bacterium]
MKYIQFFLLLLITSCRNTSAPPTLPKISVICPTYNRSDRHANLYAAFDQQTYENKELLVLDDSPEPSLFFTHLKDPRVKYINLPERGTIGFKRNFLIGLASGELIAHFDDDDYYAPTYLTTMVNQLGSADLVKLSRWLAWREIDGTFWEWDTRFVGEFHFVVTGNNTNIYAMDIKKASASDLTFQISDWMDANTWGYGFSYLYRKSLWKECPFEDMNGGEDYNFITRARTFDKKLIHIPDYNHIAVHTLHPKSTSQIFPQYLHDSSTNTEMLGKGATPWLMHHN